MMHSLKESSQQLLGVLPHYLRLKGLGAAPLAPIVPLLIEGTRFTVKTATEPRELEQVLKMRYRVFKEEFMGKESSPSLLPYDVDDFDFHCDHLIVTENGSSRVVATYRLMSSLDRNSAEEYYSSTEFHIQDFLALDGIKLELGRACVDPEFRNGEVISLLWRGLCAYAREINARYLFGCSSITVHELSFLPSIIAELEKRDSFLKDKLVTPLPAYTYGPEELPAASGEGKLNSLMNMYLLAGARLYPDFAYDRDFGCLDVFTVIDMTKLPPSFARRFAC